MAFSPALCAVWARGGAARSMLAFMASPQVAAAKRRHGMEPA
jgi:molybdate transport system substrate-binding protein